MHASNSVELAALVANSGPVLIRAGSPLSETSMKQYWTASKCRLDRWKRAIKSHEMLVHQSLPRGRDARRDSFVGVLEEILAGEVLTRVWTGVLIAYDRRHPGSEARSLGWSVFVGHMEARNRTLNLMVHGRGISAEEILALNRLRQRAERWTDMLLGYLMLVDDVRETAFDGSRAKEFAADLRHQQSTPSGHRAWRLVVSSLRAAFRNRLVPQSPNADLNRRVASAVLACFQPELFDSAGPIRSLWQWRLSNTTADAQAMLEELLAADSL